DDAFRHDRRFSVAMSDLLNPRRGMPTRAREIMQTDPPHVAPDTPIGALLPMLASGECDAVPVLDGPRIVGIVTQTDLISALARQSLRQDLPAH
ncbi:CBS domain-containing protein, partial [Paracoccus sp. PXZ]